jgi:hypothetical protein
MSRRPGQDKSRNGDRDRKVNCANDPLSFSMLGDYALNLALIGRIGEAARFTASACSIAIGRPDHQRAG